jgi:hypothetical protein
MTKSNLKTNLFLRFFVSALILIIALPASARPDIFERAKSKGIRVTGCTSCHRSPSGGRETLKPNYLKAYNLDQSGLSRLKNLINGCAKNLLFNSVNFVCDVPVTVSGVLGSRTKGAAASDVYRVTCGPGSDNLTASVTDNKPINPSKVAIKLVKGSLASVLSMDAVDGDAIPSPVVKLTGKNGNYLLTISKTLSTTLGQELYTANFLCRSVAGGKTATGSTMTKNQ